MILEARNVSYCYRSRKEKRILDHMDAGFSCGKLYAVLGPSGSGKTTFLSLLAGLDVPTEGEICYEGRPVSARGLREHRKRHVSLVFQSYNLIDYLTVTENVRLGGRKEPGKLLESMGIGPEFWKRNVLQLSGGQQQRVAIARALASEAKVLLADEPTGNLDEATAFEVTAILKRIAHEEDRCVIVVTHSRELAGEADEIIRIGAAG